MAGKVCGRETAGYVERNIRIARSDAAADVAPGLSVATGITSGEWGSRAPTAAYARGYLSFDGVNIESPGGSAYPRLPSNDPTALPDTNPTASAPRTPTGRPMKNRRLVIRRCNPGLSPIIDISSPR